MLGHQEDFEALAAAACYEPLNKEEATRFDDYLEAHPEWRVEFEELQAFSAFIPADPIEFGGDLRPVVREEIRRIQQRGWWIRRIFAPVATACFVGLLALYGVYSPESAAPEEAAVARIEAPASPVAEALTRADAALESREITEAIQVLEAAIAQAPEDPLAGRAQERVAGLYFGELQRYEAAYAAYDLLRRTYPEDWNGNTEAIRRFNVLTETRDRDFEALYALDAAEESAEPFAAYEQIIARNPNSLMAMEAVNRMRDAVGALEAQDGLLEVAGLEMVRKHCSDPVAIAQVNLLLGDRYLQQLNDREQARQRYIETASQSNGALASAAQQALARLEAAP